jgi:hypothetical protein
MRIGSTLPFLKKISGKFASPFFPFIHHTQNLSVSRLSFPKGNEKYGFLECDSRQELNALQVTFFPKKGKKTLILQPEG